MSNDICQSIHTKNRMVLSLFIYKRIVKFILEMIRYFRLLRGCIQQQRSSRSFSSKIEASENEPIKFTTSAAAHKKTIRPVAIKYKPSDMPWYQPYSVLASITVFLIYFCLLREESDVDLEFNKTLYERIKGLEKEQLLQSYRYNKENGLSVEAIEERLKQLELEEAKAVA